MKWYLKALGNWTDFKTRSSRQEYWMFVLFNFLFGILARMTDFMLGIVLFVLPNGQSVGPVWLVYGMAVLVPLVAVMVRRLHDVGKSGWFVVLLLGALFGIAFLLGGILTYYGDRSEALTTAIMGLSILGMLIWFIVLLATPGVPAPNKWGPNPNSMLKPKSF